MTTPGALAAGLTARQIADGVRGGRLRATDVVAGALSAADRAKDINAFTTVTAERARRRAAEIDARVAAEQNPGPLAGVPFAAKDLFDIEGVVTLAGSRVLATNPPAARDAAAVAALEEAGAILVGALNMEEFAYGFLTDNAHYGRTRNPHDPARTAGGSSGGSGAAVAAGIVPLALGSDTNGSIRIPASFCGAVGMKPTFGRVDRTGMVPLAPSQDHVGWIAGDVQDAALAWQVFSGETCAAVPLEDITVGVAAGYFAERLSAEARAALQAALMPFPRRRPVELPAPEAARAAAYAITSSEASALRLDDLRRSPELFDPATRYRFLAGALLPAAWYIKAKRFQAWFRDQLERLFDGIDLLVLPASPIVAPRFGDETVAIDGKTYPLRPTIGRFTQPISPAGFPIICLPVPGVTTLPVGVQLVSRPGSETYLLGAALALERALAGAAA